MQEEESPSSITEEFAKLQQEVNEILAKIDTAPSPHDIIDMQHVFFLWFLWADFHLYILEPTNPSKVPPEVFILPNGRKVYDYGYVISTSVGDDLVQGHYSSRKLLESVDYIIDLAVTRYDIQKVAFEGHEVAKRKAFENIMQYTDKNIEISNFTAGDWGELRLKVINELSKRGLLKMRNR